MVFPFRGESRLPFPPVSFRAWMSSVPLPWGAPECIVERPTGYPVVTFLTTGTGLSPNRRTVPPRTTLRPKREGPRCLGNPSDDGCARMSRAGRLRNCGMVIAYFRADGVAGSVNSPLVSMRHISGVSDDKNIAQRLPAGDIPEAHGYSGGQCGHHQRSIQRGHRADRI